MKKVSKYFQILKRTGLKITQARLALLAILETQDAPIDVLHIITLLNRKKVSMNQVTIYRILEILEKENVVRKIELHEGKFRYELATDDHHHLICKKCGTIQNVTHCPMNAWEKNIFQKQHFFVERHALEFFGLCKQCQ